LLLEVFLKCYALYKSAFYFTLLCCTQLLVMVQRPASAAEQSTSRHLPPTVTNLNLRGVHSIVHRSMGAVYMYVLVKTRGNENHAYFHESKGKED